MNLKIIEANPETESEELSAMQVAVLPDEKPFPQTVWMEEKIRTWWVKIDGEKVGIVSIENDSAPGATYESESEESIGSVYLILIGFIPECRGRGLGSIVMQWLKAMVRFNQGTRIVSNLRPSNIASDRLHTKAGFRQIDLKRNYYSNPDANSPVLELRM